MSVVAVTRTFGASARKRLTSSTMSLPSLPPKKFQYARSTAPPEPRAHEDRRAAPPAAAVARRSVRRERRCEVLIDHSPLHRGKPSREGACLSSETWLGDCARGDRATTGDDARRGD